MSPGRGRFLLLGSGEFEPWSGPAERFALGPASGDGSVAILATASGREGQAVYYGWAAKGLAHFAALGIPAVAVPVRTRAEALAPGVADHLDGVSMVFFSGGSPGYLAETLTGTPIWDAVERLLDRGGVFAGCSAGAMIAGARITPAGNGPLPFPFGSGMGLLPTTVLGVHWDAMSAWWIRWLRDLAPRRLAPGLQSSESRRTPQSRRMGTGGRCSEPVRSRFGPGPKNLRSGRVRASRSDLAYPTSRSRTTGISRSVAFS